MNLRGGSARAEFKTLKLPKAGEFQIDLGAIVQDIPPFPTVEKEDMVYYHYKPAYALNKNTLAEGPLPPFSCYMITSYASGSFEQWFLDHGEWTGESGPCPLDSSQVPPAKTYEAE